MSNDNKATGHNLDTSEGARAYVAEFFANQVRRHDFRAYITTRLAADFACALAKHLAARQSAPHDVPWQVASRAMALLIQKGEIHHDVTVALAEAIAARQPEASNQVVENVEQLGVDGQPVGQGPVGEVTYSDSAGFVVSWRNGRPAKGTKLYAAPPVQAVDLTAVRAALDAAEGLAVACASVDCYSREEVAASGRAMSQQFADARALVDFPAAGREPNSEPNRLTDRAVSCGQASISTKDSTNG